MPDKTTLIFLGTPEFSCPFLEQLARDERFEVLAVITQEDKPQGRKKILTPTPVKTTAERLGLKVFQPIRLNKDQELIYQLKQMSADFLLVIAYGQILSSNVLALPKIKPINVHGSILPQYRGASPIEQALLNGDNETGLSIMEMVPAMDAGPVYSFIRSQIAPDDTDLTLRQKLAHLGSLQLPDILLSIKNGKLQAIEQEEAQATFCSKITREQGQITPATQTADEIYNTWRAFYPWPGIFLNLKGKNLKLINIKPALSETIAPGKFQIEQNRLFMGCNEGTIEILQLQMEGKTIQDSKTFLGGNRQFFQS